VKSKYRRFIGNGDIWVGSDEGHKRRAWQIECRACRRLGHAHCHAMNPEDVWRQFERSGWRLGHNTGEDECGDCVERRRQEHKKLKEQRQEDRREQQIEEISVATLVKSTMNGSKIPDEPGMRARLALAVLVQEMLVHTQWELHDVFDLIPLAMRFFQLDGEATEAKHIRQIRHLLKVAAFSRGQQDATAARVEMRRLLAEVDEAREEAERVERDSAAPTHEVKSSTKTFAERFGSIAKITTQLEPPRAVELKPTIDEPPEEARDEEPAWLRKARARMT
jgi:hypothetical protein